MTEELNHKTFNLIEVLSGRSFPEHSVPVFFNEELGFEIYTLNREIERAVLLDNKEEAKKKDDEFQSLLQKAANERYVVHLKGIPEVLRRDIISKIQEEFPDETDILGRAKPNPKADNEFTKRMWTAYIEYIESPDGSQAFVDEAEAAALFDTAPMSVHESINEGIKELQVGAKSGFESAAKEVDFLSIASPEG